MAQEYVIRGVKKGKPWKNSYGEFQSYALSLTGVGEPVKLNKTMPVNKEPEAGDVLYGELLEETAADGRSYYKFKSEPRPVPKRDDSAIQAQWAIRVATDVWIAQGCDTAAYDNIETEAKHFFAMITRVKGAQ